MDRKTANQLADELIKSEKASTAKKRDAAPVRTRGESGLGQFVAPVIITSLTTWLSLSAGASGLLALAMGIGAGLAASHLIVKHIL